MLRPWTSLSSSLLRPSFLPLDTLPNRIFDQSPARSHAPYPRPTHTVPGKAIHQFIPSMTLIYRPWAPICPRDQQREEASSSSPHAIFFSGLTPQQWEGFCGIATFSLEVHLHTPIYAVPLRGKCTLLSPPPPPSSSKRHQKNSFPGNFLPPPLPSVPGAQNRSTLVKRRGKRGHKTQQFFPSCHGSVDRGGGRPEGRSKRCASSIPAKRPGRRQAGLPPPPLTIGIATHFARQLFVSVFPPRPERPRHFLLVFA